MQSVDMKDLSTAELAQGVQQFEHLLEHMRPLARQLFPVSEEIPKELRVQFFQRVDVMTTAFKRDTGVPTAHLDALLFLISMGAYTQRLDAMRQEMKRRAEVN